MASQPVASPAVPADGQSSTSPWERLDGRLRLLVALSVALAMLALYLAIALWQTSHRLNRLASEAFLGTMTLPMEQGLVRLFRDSASGRPQLSAADGTVLLEFDDRHSSLFVDGAAVNLWQFSHSYALDQERQRLYRSVRAPNWELQQVVTVTGPASVSIEYFLLPLADMRHVDLLVNHFRWWFRETTPSDDGFQALVAAGSPPGADQAASPAPVYEVRVRALHGLSTRVSDPVRAGFASAQGVGNVVVSFTLADPPFNRRVELAAEEVAWRQVE